MLNPSTSLSHCLLSPTRMSSAHYVLKALHAFLQMLKLPRGVLHRLRLCFGRFLLRLWQTLCYQISWARAGKGDSTTGHNATSNTHRDAKRGCYDADSKHVRVFDNCASDFTFEIICASTVPLSTGVGEPSRVLYPPLRQRSLSYPNLRQSITPVTTMMLSPRPRSIHLPSPNVDTTTFIAPSHSSATLSVAGLDSSHLAQVRAEFIEADSLSERRVRRARSPARSAFGGRSPARLRSRQPSPRPSSRARSLSPMPQYPPSLAGSRISLALSASESSHVDGGYMIEKPIRMSTEQNSADSPLPTIHLELESPPPEQQQESKRRLRASTGGTMEVDLQYPSTESLPGLSDRYSSPAPSRSPSRRSRVSYDDDPTSMTTARESGELKTVGRSPTPSSSSPSLPPGRILIEIAPGEGPRYDSRQAFLAEESARLEVPRVCLTFPHSTDWHDPDLRGWVPVTHPEGCLYFHHQEKRIFTDAYLYLPAYIDEVEALVEHLDRLSETPSGSLLPSGCELVLQVTFEEWEGASSVIWQYYYVHHKTRSLFWLRDFEVGEYLGEILGPVSPAHFKHMLQSWYWDHVSHFPNSFQSHEPLVEELVGDLTFFCTDYITSPTTTVPYSLAELMDMIRLLGGKETGAGATPIAAALGRMMSVFSHWRYIHYHGQRYVRVDRNESIRSPSSTRPRTWLMSIFCYLFLFAPKVHLSEIENIYVDGIIVTYLWKRHITKLQDEWQELIQYATIILTANVSMLSVPDVILFPGQPSGVGGSSAIQNYTPPLRSPAAIASYISILCSIGSIVLGLMLVRHHRTKNHDFADEASAYMQQQDRPYFHHEPLAILYSLPYALLMWAMLSFLASVMIFTLVKTDIATQSTVAAVSLVVSCLIVWCAAAAWDREAPRRHLWRVVKQILSSRQSDLSQGLDTSPTTSLSEKAGRLSRLRLRSLAKKMRGTRIARTNAAV